MAGETAKRDAVGRSIILENLDGGGEKLIRQPCRRFGRWVLTVSRQRRDARRLRIGIVNRIAEVVAANNQHEAVLADRLDKQLGPVDFDLSEFLDHGLATIVRRSAGPAVGDQAVFIQGAEVAPDGDVPWADGEVDAERLEHASANAVLERVVTEQSQVAGAAARRDPQPDRDAQSADAVPGKCVQIRGASRLQLGLAAGRQRQSAQAVGHQKHEFSAVCFLQLAGHVMDFHAGKCTHPRT